MHALIFVVLFLVTPVRQDGWAAQTPSQTRANFYQLEQLDKRAKKALMHQHADIIRTPHSQGKATKILF